MAVAGMLALSSCSNDDNDMTQEKNAPRQMTFTAGFGDDGAQTRATLSGKSVSFDANDQISILSANNTNTAFTTMAGGASATFTGEAVDDSKFYAVYPYTDGLTLSGDVITGVVIPTSQWNSGWNLDNTAYSGWDPKAPVAYATTTNGDLQFHNACAILKVTIGGGYDTNVTLTISANQPLAGTFSLDTSTGTLTATAGSNTVSVGNYDYGYGYDHCINQDEYTDKTIYVAIAPGTYTGFNLNLCNVGGGNITVKKSGGATFAAGKIYDLGTHSLQNEEDE